jgi:hypothetical protein
LRSALEEEEVGRAEGLRVRRAGTELDVEGAAEVEPVGGGARA